MISTYEIYESSKFNEIILPFDVWKQFIKK
jgi:hypothetical protein